MRKRGRVSSRSRYTRSRSRQTPSRDRRIQKSSLRSRTKLTKGSGGSNATSAASRVGSSSSASSRSVQAPSVSGAASCDGQSATPGETSRREAVDRVGDGNNACFGVLYWGSASEDGWDLSRRAQSPFLCGRCDGLADSWRGRFENAQVTLRVCAEGAGHKRYVQQFLMLSAGTSVEIDLPTFSSWTLQQGREALTERVVLGTILQVHNRRISPEACGMRVQSRRSPIGCAWHETLRCWAGTLCQEAHQSGGALAALLLDARGRELRAAEMVLAQKRALARSGGRPIHRLLVLLGGPSGIQPAAEQEMAMVLKDFLDFPLLCCSLPGGLMHSYYALTSLFVLHDQGVLLPFLSQMAEELLHVSRHYA